MNDHGKPKIRIDRFTATAGAAVLVAIAVGFVFFAFSALATGCISLEGPTDGTGILYCKPDAPYWVATLSFLLIGLVLIFVSVKLVQAADKHI
ncbi:hypothetical protein [Paucimonas lemoignei]|uniref:hypothetical protein n=1 Tax=Paucimonas lemoignei TaxID=29443 RepID=UPI001047A825|nr:hypothetical protein [Paucimonas lemoignei]